MQVVYIVNPINFASLKFSGHFLVLKAYLRGENYVYDESTWKRWLLCHFVNLQQLPFTYTVHRMTKSTSYPSDRSMLVSRTLHLRMTVCRRSGNVKRRVPGTSSSSHTDTITSWTEIRLRQINTYKRSGRRGHRGLLTDQWEAAVTHLRGRANEAWPHCTHSVFQPTENPGDSVGFGEEGGIADGERRAEAEAS